VRRAASHPWLALTCSAAVVAGAIAAVAIFQSRGSERRAGCRAALVPAYLPPGEIGDLIRPRAYPGSIVINPHSGPGGRPSPAYRRATRAAQAAGAYVLGYVATGHGRRPLAAVEADVDRYRSWYGVDGIFFDEAATSAADLPYYRALSQHARGLALTVALNPGAVPAAGYFDLADIVVTFEGTYAGYAAALQAMPAWLSGAPRKHAAHLIYDSSRPEALHAAAGAAAGYVYATSGTLPNPWRGLPAYLSDEQEALSPCR
jgi:hypothetical protein